MVTEAPVVGKTGGLMVLKAAVTSVHIDSCKRIYRAMGIPENKSKAESTEAVSRFMSLAQQEDRFKCLVSERPFAKRITSNHLKQLQQLILKNTETKRRSYITLSVLSHWINIGNEKAFWSLCPPPMPVWVPAPVSPFTYREQAYTSDFLKLQLALTESLKLQSELESTHQAEVLVGQFLLSTILLGDIHNMPSLKALLVATAGPILFSSPLGWVDLHIVKPRQVATELRRWFPDPVSELLYYRLGVKPRRLVAEQVENSRSTTSMFSYIKMFLRSQGLGRDAMPSGFKALFAVANHQHMLASSSVMASYTARRFASHSLRASAWHRLLGSYVPEESHPIDSDRQASSQEEDFSFQAVTPETMSWFDAFQQSVFAEGETLKQCISACEKYMQKSRVPEVWGCQTLIPQWVLYLLTERQKVRGKLAVSSIKGYLASAGRRLVSAAGDIDLSELDEAGFEDLYWPILEDAESDSLKRKIRKGLSEFHEFIVRRYAVPELTDSSILGLGHASVPVDANLIGLDEYVQCILELRKDRQLNAFDPQLSLIAEMIVTIGFRCGARRSEVLKLRLADYHPGVKAELLIRPWSNRRLKTKSSTRKLPLYALLSPEELKLMQGWYQNRLEEVRCSEKDDSEAYLFALPEKGMNSIPEEFVFQKIHRVLRGVTGDSTLRFHHLRHSFASWLVLRLLLSDLNAVPELIPHQPKTQAWLQDAGLFKQTLYGHGQLTRKHLYAVASLLGHSSPVMSLEHYIHTLDIYLLASRKQSVSNTVLIQLAPVASGKLYQHKTQDSLLVLLAMVRHAKENTALANNLGASGDGQGQLVSQGCLGSAGTGFKFFEDLHGFLVRYSQDQQQDVSLLGSEYGYSPDESARYIENALAIAGSTTRRHSTYRFKVIGGRCGKNSTRGVVPAWRLGEQDRDDFEIMTNGLFDKVMDVDATLLGVVRDYLSRVSQSKRGLTFAYREREPARQYIRLLAEAGMQEGRLQVQFYKGGNDSIKSKWLGYLDSHSFTIAPNVTATNPASQSLVNSIKIKLTSNSYTELSADSESRALSLLMFLLGVRCNCVDLH